ncbi:helix-turn-helix domain-containing protein [Paraferrimonas sedimenticola]|uniref:HTH araC/xylS-type domain-containing protein n=1 Tax=Paraferrimonas sedimenticola TaxID=375674 RepID=A0AA37VVH0_9GAMM|nr:helix-turn-helix transcriptional regulator [Paraferrimonas sedimenticola]GLP96056.1 hypothetical protein GCM10007895_13620 [Paraferrimonas sedimenticola]
MSQYVKFSYRTYSTLESFFDEEPFVDEVPTMIQLDPGTLKAERWRLDFDDLIIQKHGVNLAINVAPVYGDGWLRAGLFTGPVDQECSWQGVSIKPGTLFITPKGGGVFSIPAGYQDLTLILSYPLMDALGIEKPDTWLGSDNLHRCFYDIPEPMGDNLENLMDDLCQRYKLSSNSDWNAIIDPGHAAQIRIDLLRLLSDCLTRNVPNQTDSAPSKRFALVNRTIAHISALEDSELAKLSIDDLSNQVAASRKTLLRAFNDVLGINPSKYLNNVKLAKAHALINTGQHQITQVGLKFGYSKPGYFAEQYQLLYGELPSQTLKRAKSGQ